MSESTTRAGAEKAAASSAQPPPPPGYPTNPQPYAAYGANPMGPSVVMYPQGVMYPPMDPNIQKIHEYLPWSIINICFGGCVLGIIAIILSLQTRSRKRSGDAASARCWSIATLIYNICVSLVGIGIIIFIIVYFVVVVNAVKNVSDSYQSYGK